MNESRNRPHTHYIPSLIEAVENVGNRGDGNLSLHRADRAGAR